MHSSFRRPTRAHVCWRAAGLSVVVALASVGAPAWAQEDKLPSADKILEKSLEGRGGRAAFEKLTSRVSKGTFEVSSAGPSQKLTAAQYEAAPNKRYFVLEPPQGPKIEAGTDGETHWLINGPRAELREGDDKAVAERQADFYALLHWKEQYEKVETVGKEQVDDRSCYKVVLTPKVGPPETIYFDRKSGLPAKTESTRKTPQGDLQIQTRLEDFREVDGVRLPFKSIRQVTGGGPPQTYTTVWESIEHNVDIPAERFALPDAVKALLDKTGDQPAESKGKKQKPE